MLTPPFHIFLLHRAFAGKYGFDRQEPVAEADVAVTAVTFISKLALTCTVPCTLVVQ